jgi:hypothetical protein
MDPKLAVTVPVLAPALTASDESAMTVGYPGERPAVVVACLDSGVAEFDAPFGLGGLSDATMP